ncbi:MAG: type II toxin-antitoxin system RelE/ParE family toxin [Chloroflexi bacterium]|nr:type II toxin-antitoxin system RelE/ParE family toxin [Chloroflexota bacterium]
MPHKVEFSPAAARELRRLPAPVRGRLEPAILGLGSDPRPSGVRKIQGSARAYRIRLGEYRVVYNVYEDEKLVVVLRVGRRSERTYQRL